jgi:hypothetical protein
MAMEIFALSDRRLNSIAEWQRAVDAEGFALQLSAETPFAQLSGFLPVRYDNAPSGFECDHWEPSAVMDENPSNAFGHAWTYALAFRFGVRPGELESAWMAAAAYARATAGVVFDTEENRIFQPDEAARLVRKIESNRANIDHEAIQKEILRRVRGEP